MGKSLSSVISTSLSSLFSEGKKKSQHDFDPLEEVTEQTEGFVTLTVNGDEAQHSEPLTARNQKTPLSTQWSAGGSGLSEADTDMTGYDVRIEGETTSTCAELTM